MPAYREDVEEIKPTKNCILCRGRGWHNMLQSLPIDLSIPDKRVLCQCMQLKKQPSKMGVEKIDSPQALPANMCLVPIDPTPELIAALFWDGDVDMMLGHAAIAKEGYAGYRAMIDLLLKQSAAAVPATHFGNIDQAAKPGTGNSQIIEDARQLDWLEAQVKDTSYAIELRQLRDPSVNAGVNRIEVTTKAGAGPWSRRFEASGLREAISVAMGKPRHGLSAPLITPSTPSTVTPVPSWEQQIQSGHPKSDPEFWSDELKCKYMAAEILGLRALIASKPPQDAQ